MAEFAGQLLDAGIGADGQDWVAFCEAIGRLCQCTPKGGRQAIG